MSLKEKIGRFKLKRALKKIHRTPYVFNLETAKTIAVLYDATNRNDYETVKKFVHFLKEERKNVIALGYIDAKNDSEIVKPHLNYQFFSKRNLNKLGIPFGNEVDQIINYTFDLLIDLNMSDDCFPIEYISTLSLAKFKVGASGSYRDNAMDLTINIEKNKTLDYLIIQIKHYLKIINVKK